MITDFGTELFYKLAASKEDKDDYAHVHIPSVMKGVGYGTAVGAAVPALINLRKGLKGKSAKEAYNAAKEWIKRTHPKSLGDVKTMAANAKYDLDNYLDRKSTKAFMGTVGLTGGIAGGTYRATKDALDEVRSHKSK